MDKVAALESEPFQELADCAPAMLWRINASFDCDWANKAWFDFTGGTLEDQRGFAWIDRVHPEDREAVVQAFDGAFAARQPASVEFRLQGRDGQYRWFLDSGTPFYREGEFAGFVGSCTDITERKAAEERMQRLTDEIVRLARAEALSAMSAALVHELGQPVQTIGGYAEGMARLLAGGEADRAVLTEAVEAVRQAALRASAIFENCRSLVAGRPSGRTRSDVAAVLRAAEPLILAHPRASGVEVEWALSEGLEAEVSRLQLEQVLINLTANAFEAMAGRQSRKLRVSAAPWGALAIVSVCDNGPGIPAGLRKRIFDSLVTTKATGMGIGLYVCQTIIAAHGGRIWAEAAPEGGALLKFTIPLAP
jgi:PAS domain S-box-containing protein